MDEANSKKIVDVSTLAYDLNAITDFIFQNNSKDKSNEIKEVYEADAEGVLKLKQKALSESKSENMDSSASIRYSIVMNLMDRANSIIMDEYEDVDGVFDEANDISSPVLSHLGDTFAINTLIREGMLVNMDLSEIDDKE